MISFTKLEYNRSYDFIYQILGLESFNSGFVRVLSTAHLIITSIVTVTFL